MFVVVFHYCFKLSSFEIDNINAWLFMKQDNGV